MEKSLFFKNGFYFQFSVFASTFLILFSTFNGWSVFFFFFVVRFWRHCFAHTCRVTACSDCCNAFSFSCHKIKCGLEIRLSQDEITIEIGSYSHLLLLTMIQYFHRYSLWDLAVRQLNHCKLNETDGLLQPQMRFSCEHCRKWFFCVNNYVPLLHQVRSFRFSLCCCLF